MSPMTGMAVKVVWDPVLHEYTEANTNALQIMLSIKRGQHGSTYGGNPVAARVAVAALKVLVDEGLAQNSDRMGKLLRTQLQAIPSSRIAEVRPSSGCGGSAIDRTSTAALSQEAYGLFVV